MKTQYRRARKGYTDYRQRLKILKSRQTRMVIRKSNKHIIIQAVKYSEKGDQIIASASSKELQKLGWKGATCNTPAAYLTGLLFAKKAAKLGEFVVDIGMQVATKQGVLFAAVKGAIDGGLHTKAENIFPTNERITGKHIAEYATKLGENAKKRFSAQTAHSLDPSKISQHFEEIKKKVTQNA